MRRTPLSVVQEPAALPTGLPERMLVTMIVIEKKSQPPHISSSLFQRTTTKSPSLGRRVDLERCSLRCGPLGTPWKRKKRNRISTGIAAAIVVVPDPFLRRRRPISVATVVAADAIQPQR